MLWIAVLGKGVLVSMLLGSAHILVDASSPISMSLCLGRKPEKPNEETLLERYQKRRNRRAQLSTKEVSLVRGQQKAEGPGVREKCLFKNGKTCHHGTGLNSCYVLWTLRDKTCIICFLWGLSDYSNNIRFTLLVCHQNILTEWRSLNQSVLSSVTLFSGICPSLQF